LTVHREPETQRMTEADYTMKLDEVERLLNDPDTRMEPARVWSLLDELARHHAASGEV
jgi:hypothetical protein